MAAGGTPCDFRPLPAEVDGLAFWLGGTRGELPEQYHRASPAAFVSPDDPPFFFFHGEGDQLVPLLSPRAMCAQLAAAGVPAELYVAPKIGHIACALDQTSVERAVTFLAQHLGTPQP